MIMWGLDYSSEVLNQNILYIGLALLHLERSFGHCECNRVNGAVLLGSTAIFFEEWSDKKKPIIIY